MLFNLDKCKLMHIGYNNPRADYSTHDINLQTVADERDLGVIISEDLKWQKQCSMAVCKVNKLLGMMKRNFSDTSKKLLYPCIKVWLDHTSNVAAKYGVQYITSRILS